VGADFLRRSIAPLQKRDRFAWRYGDVGDRMRLYPGLTNNLSVYGHGWLCEQLFGSLRPFKLPARVVPLNINSALDQILKWMPDCNAYGVAADWQLPELDAEIEWVSNLEERASRVEGNMFKCTSTAEAEFIRRRIEEDKALRATGKARPGGEEKEEEEEAEDEGSSHGKSEGNTMEEAAGGEPAGVEALYAAATEAQERDEAEEAEQPEGEWLATGPQAPEPDLEQRPHRRVSRGTMTSTLRLSPRG